MMARQSQPTSEGRHYIGIDNGVSGSIGVINHTATKAEFFPTPTRSCLNYTKEAKNVTRVDVEELEKLLAWYPNPLVLLERPMVNPGRFQATASALRALEATLIVLERLEIPFIYVDSREWQKPMLPNGIKGADNLKRASLDVGCRLFPHLKIELQRQKDSDGLLIAEWARRERL